MAHTVDYLLHNPHSFTLLLLLLWQRWKYWRGSDFLPSSFGGGGDKGQGRKKYDMSPLYHPPTSNEVVCSLFRCRGSSPGVIYNNNIHSVDHPWLPAHHPLDGVSRGPAGCLRRCLSGCLRNEPPATMTRWTNKLTTQWTFNSDYTPTSSTGLGVGWLSLVIKKERK